MSDQVKELIDAGVHFGHKTSKWCPKMKPFIWGARNKVYFIDVTKTAFILEKACTQIKTIASNGGKILWVGTKTAAQPSIKLAGQELEMPIVYHRWIGGTLTNFDQVKKGVLRLMHLKDAVKKPLLTLKKKEVVRMQKEAERLEKNFGGIATLKYPPAAMIVVDVKKEATAVKEAVASNVPVIGLVDTNSDPSSLTIAIPTNDDSEKAIAYIVSKLIEAAKDGLALLKTKRQQEKDLAKSDTEKILDKEAKNAKIKKRATAKESDTLSETTVAAVSEANLPTEGFSE
jgi:small subunit ribosomal protein S2